MAIITSQAPTRISLFGGGSDLPAFYQDHGGIVVSMAINVYQKITMYTKEDLFTIPDNKFTSQDNSIYIYNALEEYRINGMHHTKFDREFNGMTESGLGSSGALGVCLIAALEKRIGNKLDRAKIAKKAWEFEVYRMGIPSGKQDQYASAFGGFNLIEFSKETKIIPLPLSDLADWMVLMHTGIARAKKNDYKSLSTYQIVVLKAIKQLAIDAFQAILRKEWEMVGKLLDISWTFKKESSENVSFKEIDEIYKFAKSKGAIGGKILGSGGGGYMVFIVPPPKRDDFILSMEEKGLIHQSFSVAYDGVKIKEL